MAMTTNARNTIRLKVFGEPMEDYYEANAAITPGMIVEEMSTGKVRAHATAGGNVAPLMVALEDSLQGNGIDDAYAAADQVRVATLRSGDEFYAVILDGQSIVIGDFLESAGNGYLQEHSADVESPGQLTVYPRQIVAKAMEACDTSDSSGAESSGTLDFAKRCRVVVV